MFSPRRSCFLTLAMSFGDVSDWTSEMCHASELSASMSEKEAIYRLATGTSEIAVYSDGVRFQQGDSPLASVWIARKDLVSVMNRAFREEWQPDAVVVIFRDSVLGLEHLTWFLANKGVSREVSDAIYKIIDGGFWKSLLGFIYALTHRIELDARL